jgi:hypothetical protein
VYTNFDSIYDNTVDIDLVETFYKYKLFSINCEACNVLPNGVTSLEDNMVIKRSTVYLTAEKTSNQTVLNWNYFNDLSIKDTTEFVLYRNNSPYDTIVVTNDAQGGSLIEVDDDFEIIEYIIPDTVTSSYYIEYNSNQINAKSLTKTIMLSNKTNEKEPLPTDLFEVFEPIDFVMVNPSVGLDIRSDEELNVKVFDLSGRLVDVQSGSTIKSQPYTSGMYVVLIESDGKIEERKLVVRNN